MSKFTREQEKHLRSKTSGVNISNLYDLGKSLAPYIITNETINFSKNKILKMNSSNNETTYTIPNTEVKEANIVIISNSSVICDLINNSNITLNNPSGKIIIENGNLCYPGKYDRLQLKNSYINSESSILLTINEFDSISIPVLVIEKIETGNCFIRIYNSGTEDLPSNYTIAFLVLS